jgi:hypothetical protein
MNERETFAKVSLSRSSFQGSGRYGGQSPATLTTAILPTAILPTAQLCPSPFRSSLARISTRRILPDTVLGSSGTNSMMRGYL